MKRLLNRLKMVLRMFIATKGGTHASSIAYYVFMSMIPLMVIFAALVPVTGISAEEVTNAFLKEKGLKVLEIPSCELSRGRGGPRCMSMPLIRED